jgi:hypothetical protein
MQEQVLQESANVRLTEEEAALFVSLHAEREQKSGATTLRDLAETLQMPTEDAYRLLAEVKAKLAPPEAVAVPVVTAPPKKKKRRWPRFLLGGVVAATAFWLTWVAGVDSGRRHGFHMNDGWRYQEAYFPLTGQITQFDPTVKSPYEIGVQFGYEVVRSEAIYLPSRSVKPDESASIKQVSVAVVEGLERLATNENISADGISVAIRPNDRDWTSFSIHLGPDIRERLGSTSGLKTIREAVTEAIKSHWDAIKVAPTDP